MCVSMIDLIGLNFDRSIQTIEPELLLLLLSSSTCWRRVGLAHPFSAQYFGFTPLLLSFDHFCDRVSPKNKHLRHCFALWSHQISYGLLTYLTTHGHTSIIPSSILYIQRNMCTHKIRLILSRYVASWVTDLLI